MKISVASDWWVLKSGRSLRTSDKLVAFLQVARQPSFEEYRVDAELCVEQRHVTIETGQELHADVTLLEVRVDGGERIRATRTTECPTRRDLWDISYKSNFFTIKMNSKTCTVGGPAHLERGFPSDVGDEEVHGYVLTVHVLVHHLPHLRRLPIGVQIGIELEVGRERERGREGGREGERGGGRGGGREREGEG